MLKVTAGRAADPAALTTSAAVRINGFLVGRIAPEARITMPQHGGKTLATRV
ncbi:hypothetical protein [Micromonospora sp. WMMD736]|uniref:hypothetical protein n=1 Tax=Micromonospora sp. WMMD736 TaxID=3404112 RepID=UPI003B95BAF4